MPLVAWHSSGISGLAYNSQVSEYYQRCGLQTIPTHMVQTRKPWTDQTTSASGYANSPSAASPGLGPSPGD